MISPIKNLLLPSCLGLVLTACGGGGSSDAAQAGASQQSDNSISSVAEASAEQTKINVEQLRYALDARLSSVSFTFIKKTHVLEAHEFTQLSGQVDAQGRAVFEIDLASVDTGVSLRDDRLRNILFDIANFPKAVASTVINIAAVNGLAIGESLSHSGEITLSLHGVSQVLNSQLEITRLTDERISVRPKAPVLIDATDFGFTEALNELTELASLPSISASVSVSFFLIFDQNNFDQASFDQVSAQ